MQSEHRLHSANTAAATTPAAGLALRDRHSALCVKHLGLAEFQPTYAAMRQFTTSRDAETPDELWLLQLPPVYTAGLACRPEHLPRGSGIPLARTDRGGQITYHGPGQVVLYALIDLARRGIKVREFVRMLERAAIDTLAAHRVRAQCRPGAPGVYVAGAKIGALGLRVSRGRCYHGLALNVDCDLAPFAAIDPCGYPGLAVTSTRELGIEAGAAELAEQLASRLMELLECVHA
jgi:lipoyl(octanoyl) transferase